MKQLLSVVVPCYNEQESLPHLVEKLQTLTAKLSAVCELEYVLVNDGSRDRTGEILATIDRGRVGADARVVTHEVNRGLGAALKTGFAAARGELVAALDCDCTYDPLWLVEMLRAFDDQTDVLTGSEFHPDGQVIGVSQFRLLFSRTMCLMYRWLFWTKIHSFSCLLRIYRREVLLALPIQSRGFLSCTEILVRALGAGYRIREFPLTLTAREHGESKIPIVRTILDHLKFMASLRWSLWFRPVPVACPAAQA